MFITNSGIGLYSFRFELIEELLRHGYKIYLVYPNGDKKEEFIKIGCQYIDIPFDSSSTNPFNDIVLLFRFRNVIKRYKPDIALLYTIKPCIYAGYILSMLHIPYICTVTGISPALISKKFYIRIPSKYLSKIGYNGASVVYFQNSMNEELFTQMKIALHKHEMIAGSGVNLDKFQLIDYPPDDGWIKLLYIGRLKKIKGIEELAFAITKAVKGGINVKCKVIGDLGDELPEFKHAINENIIKYEGVTDDVRPYISWCDAVILPSYGEGMSNVLQEASACGRPVLASNISGCNEIFDEGITGYGFNPKDSESTFEAIKLFCETGYEQRKKMGIKAREKMEQKFDRTRIINIYTDKIKELIGENL